MNVKAPMLKLTNGLRFGEWTYLCFRYYMREGQTTLPAAVTGVLSDLESKLTRLGADVRVSIHGTIKETK